LNTRDDGKETALDADLEARLGVLLDKQEIYDLLMRYCRGIDRRDGDLIASCYHPDGVDDRRRKRSGDQVADGIASHPARQEMAMHFVGNVLIDVRGDTAYSESYCVAYLTLKPTDGVLSVGGVEIGQATASKYHRALGLRYLDKLERRNGEWRIVHRVCLDDWHQIEPIHEPPPGSAHGRWGMRSTDDPLYAFLRDDPIPEATEA
jgi:hypothetical protein